MTAYEIKNIRGPRGYCRKGGWMRALFVDGVETGGVWMLRGSDRIYRESRGGVSARNIAKRLKVPKAAIEYLLRWYANNPRARDEAMR